MVLVRFWHDLGTNLTCFCDEFYVVLASFFGGFGGTNGVYMGGGGGIYIHIYQREGDPERSVKFLGACRMGVGHG